MAEILKNIDAQLDAITDVEPINADLVEIRDITGH